MLRRIFSCSSSSDVSVARAIDMIFFFLTQELDGPNFHKWPLTWQSLCSKLFYIMRSTQPHGAISRRRACTHAIELPMFRFLFFTLVYKWCNMCAHTPVSS